MFNCLLLRRRTVEAVRRYVMITCEMESVAGYEGSSPEPTTWDSPTDIYQITGLPLEC